MELIRDLSSILKMVGLAHSSDRIRRMDIISSSLTSERSLRLNRIIKLS